MAEPRIRKLDETVANQIAAGEVVERPASVVKELVENALDAGATRIEVAIEGGGARAVTVSDNGCGMTPEEVLLSLERQATSKISGPEDIVRIATFGFRGEAVPSIASVSRFVVTSRVPDADAAARVVVNGGMAEAPETVGHPVGTTVEVRDLFFNLPARRKFLRAPATEQTRIRQVLTAVALAEPEIAFRFLADGREIFRLPSGDTLTDRIRALLGPAVADATMPVDHTQGAIHVHGRITRPDFVRLGTPEQFVFVNRRAATAPQLQYALREAFPRDRRPAVVLFVDLPPEEVDVNVHPAKREVRFRRGNLVADAVLAALARAVPTPETRAVPGTPLAVTPGPVVPSVAAGLPPIGRLPTPQAPKPRQLGLDIRVEPDPAPAAIPTPTTSAVTAPEPDSAPLRPGPSGLTPGPEGPTVPQGPAPWQWFRLLGILEGGYWLLLTEQGYVTVDGRAALERIAYERLMASAGPDAVQPLLIPETLTLPAADADRVRRFLPELQACGFGLADYGGDTFMIDAVPAFLDGADPAALIASVAAELDRAGVRRGLEGQRRETVARAAAQAACGALPPADATAAEAIVGRLGRCAMPYITPRGRPTMFLTSYRELDRRFRRS